MESMWCDSVVETMPEGDAISYTMKPTRMYKADDVADLAERMLDTIKGLEQAPVLERSYKEYEEFKAELGEIAGK